jgi:hypothetical protein
VALIATGRARLAAALAWWVLGAAFAVGIYLFERGVGRSLARAKL